MEKINSVLPRTIDFHFHFGKDLDGSASYMETIEKEMTKNNIEKICLFPLNNPNLIEDSKKILELSKEHKFIIPFLRFDPNTIEKEELAELLSMGFRGVKLHPRSQKFSANNRKFSWIFKEISNYCIPILIHTKLNQYEPMSNPMCVIEVAKHFPEQMFVIGHFAGGAFKPFEEISNLENVYVETSVFSLPIMIERIYEKHGFDRFIFGSDFPYSYPEIELLKIKLAKIPEELKSKILYKNSEKILKLRKSVTI